MSLAVGYRLNPKERIVCMQNKRKKEEEKWFKLGKAVT
jgi:hypothetical protein